MCHIAMGAMGTIEFCNVNNYPGSAFLSLLWIHPIFKF